MLYGVGFSRRTYAEPAQFVIFAFSLEVESDQRSRWLAAELLPNLGGVERRTSGLGGRGVCLSRPSTGIVLGEVRTTAIHRKTTTYHE